MSHTVIRFPTAARFERPPMATKLTVRDRLRRWLFGHTRPVNLAAMRIERARKGR